MSLLDGGRREENDDGFNSTALVEQEKREE